MTEPQLSTKQSSSTYHRVCLLVLIGVLVAIFAAFYYMSVVRQPRVNPGNTEAHPGLILL